MANRLSASRKYEALILIGDVAREDPDGLVHSTCVPVGGAFDTTDQAADAARDALRKNPSAVGYTVRLVERGGQSRGAHRRFMPHRVASDYMRPDFEPGDVVEIDTAVQKLPFNQPDGVYLLAFPSGEPALRRLQVNLTNGRVRVYCDHHDREEYDESDLRILGRATRVANVRKI